jgi:beta propeller repeat protein
MAAIKNNWWAKLLSSCFLILFITAIGVGFMGIREGKTNEGIDLALDGQAIYPQSVGQEVPEIYGTRVVWMQQGSDYYYKVFLGDLKTGTVRQLGHSPAAEKYPSIWENQVIWMDYRSIMDDPTVENKYAYVFKYYDMYGCDLEKDQGQEFPICTNPAWQGYGDTQKGRVVYADMRSGNPNIFLYDMGTKEEYAICLNPAWQGNPVIYDDYVVWMDERSGNYDIYGFDLAAGQEFPICTAADNQAYPAISGTKVIWQDKRNGDDDIYLYDLVTRKETAICVHDGKQQVPDICGNIVVWQDDRNGNWDIYGYDLTTGKEFQITDQQADQTFPAISGNRIVWVDSRSGNKNVYAAVLPADFAPKSDDQADQNRNRELVAATAALIDPASATINSVDTNSISISPIYHNPVSTNPITINPIVTTAAPVEISKTGPSIVGYENSNCKNSASGNDNSSDTTSGNDNSGNATSGSNNSGNDRSSDAGAGISAFFGEEKFSYSYHDNLLYLLHENAIYNCCIEEITVTMEMAGNTITIYEDEKLEGSGCKCSCSYDITTKIGCLEPGTYTVKFFNKQTGKLLGVIEKVIIPKIVCPVSATTPEQKCCPLPCTDPVNRCCPVAGTDPSLRCCPISSSDPQQKCFVCPTACPVAVGTAPVQPCCPCSYSDDMEQDTWTFTQGVSTSGTVSSSFTPPPVQVINYSNTKYVSPKRSVWAYLASYLEKPALSTLSATSTASGITAAHSEADTKKSAQALANARVSASRTFDLCGCENLKLELSYFIRQNISSRSAYRKVWVEVIAYDALGQTMGKHTYLAVQNPSQELEADTTHLSITQDKWNTVKRNLQEDIPIKWCEAKKLQINLKAEGNFTAGQGDFLEVFWDDLSIQGQNCDIVQMCCPVATTAPGIWCCPVSNSDPKGICCPYSSTDPVSYCKPCPVAAGVAPQVICKPCPVAADVSPHVICKPCPVAAGVSPDVICQPCPYAQNMPTGEVRYCCPIATATTANTQLWCQPCPVAQTSGPATYCCPVPTTTAASQTLWCNPCPLATDVDEILKLWCCPVPTVEVNSDMLWCSPCPLADKVDGSVVQYCCPLAANVDNQLWCRPCPYSSTEPVNYCHPCPVATGASPSMVCQPCPVPTTPLPDNCTIGKVKSIQQSRTAGYSNLDVVDAAGNTQEITVPLTQADGLAVGDQVKFCVEKDETGKIISTTVEKYDPQSAVIPPAQLCCPYSSADPASYCKPCPVTTASPYLFCKPCPITDVDPKGLCCPYSSADPASYCKPCPVTTASPYLFCKPCPITDVDPKGLCCPYSTADPSSYCKPCPVSNSDPKGLCCPYSSADPASYCKPCPISNTDPRGLCCPYSSSTSPIMVCQPCPLATAASPAITCQPCPVATGISPDMVCYPSQSGCAEDNSGELDIEDAQGMMEQGTTEPGTMEYAVTIPVRIQFAPNQISTFGFEVTYEPDVLEYSGFEPGDLVSFFEMFNVNPVDSDRIRVGGASTESIPQGLSGKVVLLKFKVKEGATQGSCYLLKLENLADDIAQFSKTGGCFCMKDTVPPEITCPADMVVAQTDLNGTPADDPDVLAFLSEAKAWDNLDGEVKVTYQIGTFESGTDGNDTDGSGTDGGGTDKSFSEPVPGAEVYAEQEPNPAPEAGEQPSSNSYGINEEGIKSDVFPSPSVLPPGTSTVIFIAHDVAGNTSSCSATITVKPIECGEDESGNLNIPGTMGKVGQEVLIPVQIQAAPNEVSALGFEVAYKPSVLEYTGYQIGDLVTSFPMFEVNSIGSGRLIVGGVSPEQSIPQGASGTVVLLKFIVRGGMEGSCYPLKLENLTDHLSQFSVTPGCFCIHNCDGDQNGDGSITPSDALAAFKCYLGSGPCGDCSDVNGDGSVTPSDALCLFRKYLGQTSCLDD